ncbi:DUF1289 domain-containing protein [Falsiroseomonas tokyonensis]|uniref:DUF1289 domain-containing protein n=1 Tax=Falsiroseomonas tokyonensis TaxID=430521 RepID=A0ABV7C230_9PROT|nr:DUF1289 domain-containing protein [Falsiroseomonas tokyonensis]MBU8541306.1 DUF1289 domain-containing protein [Falsiroseomonas tokyonensis]
MIESPCNKVCEIDTPTGLCRGCGRTTLEIAVWTQLSPAARRALMLQLPVRLKLLEKA